MINACLQQLNHDDYVPRSPRKNQYYRCIEAHFEELEGVWEERYQKNCGFWRPYVMDVIYKYLDCGDLHFGFARVKCNDCNEEYLLPFSCKRRYFCPSCHQKRVVEFGETLYEEVLKQVPHRQWVFSIPKRLRVYFMYDRKLLGKLSQCAWLVLSAYLKQGVSIDNPNPGAVIAVQTFGDFLNFNSHLHIIATDGCFDGQDNFMVGTLPNSSDLEELFRTEVFRMLKKERKINDSIIENMMTWNNSGFNVYCGDPIQPWDQEGIERLAQYVVRAPISQERMTYIPKYESTDGVAYVKYEAKAGDRNETFTALDWLARLITHIPNRGEQLVRYYGYYSNKSRGMRKKAETDEQVPALIDSDISKKKFRKNWARLIQKIYNVDPLLCPKCKGTMRIISFIEDDAVIKQILKHLNLWETRIHDPPVDMRNMHNDSIMITEFSDFVDDVLSLNTYEDDYSQLTSYDDY